MATSGLTGWYRAIRCKGFCELYRDLCVRLQLVGPINGRTSLVALNLVLLKGGGVISVCIGQPCNDHDGLVIANFGVNRSFHCSTNTSASHGGHLGGHCENVKVADLEQLGSVRAKTQRVSNQHTHREPKQVIGLTCTGRVFSAQGYGTFTLPVGRKISLGSAQAFSAGVVLWRNSRMKGHSGLLELAPCSKSNIPGPRQKHTLCRI